MQNGSFGMAFEDAEEDAAWEVDSRTVLTAEPAYDQLPLDLDDYHVIFAYPWPTEHERFRALFDRHADHGALLVTYSTEDGVRVFTKATA